MVNDFIFLSITFVSVILKNKQYEISINNKVFDVNLYGTVRVIQSFLGLLKKSAEPRIVNVSTSVGSLSLQSNPDWPA